MAYFSDHSEYRFGLEPTSWKADGPPPERPEGLYLWLWDFPDPDPVYQQIERNIGWLGANHDFPRGAHDAAFSSLLEQACSASTYHLWRGYQSCELCGVEVPRQPGPGEIRVQGTECVYASPTLVYHYVAQHAYAPPQDYVRGILEGMGRPPRPVPGSRREIPRDLLVHHDVSVEALSASVSRWIRTFREANEIHDLAIARDDEDLVVRAVLVPEGARQSSPHTWRVPLDAVLDEDQGGRGIACMLSDTLNEREKQAFQLSRARQ